MKSLRYDVIVIGGGSAGLVSSKLARGLGQRVALVERAQLGGECTWTGCVPSKTLIKSADVMHTIMSAERYGLQTNQVRINTDQVFAHIKNVITDVYQTHTPDTLTSQGIDLHFGAAQFIDSHTLMVGDAKLSARRFILCTGSQPFIPPLEGIENVPYLTNQTIFELERVPESMIILGGGAIGVEIAGALSHLGCQVTILEMAEHIVSKEDEEVARELQTYYQQMGVSIKTTFKATAVAHINGQIRVTGIDVDGNLSHLEADTLLIAAGRCPRVEGLELDRIGVEYTRLGVTVTNQLRTTRRHIYACGDLVGPYQFSHMAFYQAQIATRNAIIPIFKQTVDYTHTAWVTFSFPPLARAGLTEREARAQYGDRITVWRMPYADLDRARIDGVTQGFSKIICDRRGYILGAHIVGARAGELIHEIQVAKRYHRKFSDIYRTIHAYPTYSELIWHSAKTQYIDILQSKWAVRMIRKIVSFFRSSSP